MALVHISTGKRWALAIIAVLIMLFLFLRPHILRLADIMPGYKAKTLCSALFISKRNVESVLSEDLGAEDLSTLNMISYDINENQKWVSAHLLPWKKRFGGSKEYFLCRQWL